MTDVLGEKNFDYSFCNQQEVLLVKDVLVIFEGPLKRMKVSQHRTMSKKLYKYWMIILHICWEMIENYPGPTMVSANKFLKTDLGLKLL